MKEYVVCKSCGFVMEKGKLHDKCPACGVPAKMFEPFVDRISPFRKFILSLDIHPVLVHFPQAFSFTLLVLVLLSLILKGGVQEKILSTLSVIGFVIPFVVLFAVLAGLLDGKIRFRRVTTPILIKKIILGSLFFIFACGIFVLTQFFQIADGRIQLMILGLSVLSLGCATFLGFLGTSILNAKFPG